MTQEIRPGDLTDARVVELLREHLAGMHASSPPGSVYALDLSGLQRPEIALYTVWDGDDLLGCGALKHVDDRTGELKSMRTAARHLRRGAGARMLEHLLEVARARGYTRVCLETGSGPAFEPAIALYRKYGFVTGPAFGDYAATEFNQFLVLFPAMTLDYVDLATARDRRGTRIVTTAVVASPWSEATKGMFAVAQLPATVHARASATPEITTWLGGIDNVPVVLHDDEPPRTNWAAIVGLVARLAPGVLVPVDPAARARMMGMIDLIAGEGGLGWTSRLAMIQASFASQGERGFPLQIAKFLAKRYGFSRELAPDDLVARVRTQLGVLRDALRGPYFDGDRVSALDLYAATFLTPLTVIDDSVCPQMIEPVRRAFGSARELLAGEVPPELWAHRTMMFERHLPLPIRLA
jgi:GNAT superfamily N-acetyltransferase/glutathione S-transferase